MKSSCILRRVLTHKPGPVPLGLALQNELPADDLPLSSVALESLKKSYYFGDCAVHHFWNSLHLRTYNRNVLGALAFTPTLKVHVAINEMHHSTMDRFCLGIHKHFEKGEVTLLRSMMPWELGMISVRILISLCKMRS